MTQPVGEPVDWTPAAVPVPDELRGRHVVLRPLAPEADADPLWAESHPPRGDAGTWTYLGYGPFADAAGRAAENQREDGRQVRPLSAFMPARQL